MYFDLNVPIPLPPGVSGTQSNKGKGKQAQPSHLVQFTPAQLAAIETRIDLLVHCTPCLLIVSSNILISWPVGYSVLAFNQRVKKKVEPKTFINTLDPLLRQVKKREGIIYLKRLTIILDEDSEKSFGLVRSRFPKHPRCVAENSSADERAIQFV
jgi:ribonuclease P/MRP protein subunit RPP1